MGILKHLMNVAALKIGSALAARPICFVQSPQAQEKQADEAQPVDFQRLFVKLRLGFFAAS
jgi:hypothetical protein